MPLDLSAFIPYTIAVILVVAGILGLVWKKGGKVMRGLPVISSLGNFAFILMIVIGAFAGGFGIVADVTDMFAPAIAPAVFVGEIPVLAVTPLEKIVYTAGVTSCTGGVTVRQDPNTNNVVYLDVDESDWNSTYQAQTELNVNFSVTRGGSIHEDGSLLFVAKGDEFRSETSTTDANIYNVVETSARPSSVWAGKYEQTIYMVEGAIASTSDTKEEAYLTYTEGQKELYLSLEIELDATSFAELNNYSTKDVTVFQRVNGMDTAVARIIVNKVP